MISRIAAIYVCISMTLDRRITRVVRVRTNIIVSIYNMTHMTYTTYAYVYAKGEASILRYGIDIFIYYVPEQNSISLVACAY